MTKSNTQDVEKIWLTQKEADEYLGVSRGFFINLRRARKINVYKLNKTIFYNKKEIDELLFKSAVK